MPSRTRFELFPVADALLLAHTRARDEIAPAELDKTRAAPNAPSGRLACSPDGSRCNVRVTRRIAGPSRRCHTGSEATSAVLIPAAKLCCSGSTTRICDALWVARCAAKPRAQRSDIQASVTQRLSVGIAAHARHLTAEERCSTSYKYLTAVGPRRRGFATVLNDNEGHGRETAPRAHHLALPDLRKSKKLLRARRTRNHALTRAAGRR